MSYLADAAIESVLSDGKLAEFTAESGSTADAGVLALALTDVDALIDSALAGGYAVPVTDTTTVRLLQPHAKVLLKWTLYVRRGLNPDEALRISYEATTRWLRDVQKGDAKLPPSAAAATVPGVDTTALGTSSFGSDVAVASGMAGAL